MEVGNRVERVERESGPHVFVREQDLDDMSDVLLRHHNRLPC
jgi:hypothetical protein